MAELKCIEAGCTNDACYVYRGSTYCQNHYQTGQQQTLSACWVYAVGLIIWVGIWLGIFVGGKLGWALMNTVLFGYAPYKSLLAFPIFIGCFVLGANLWLWRHPERYASYETEVTIIEFVERNSGWFLIASGTFLIAAASFLNRPGSTASLSFPAVLFFESLSLFLLLFVVSLYWIPYRPAPKNLALLRHIKTVPFTYSVSFFAAALLALVETAFIRGF